MSAIATFYVVPGERLPEIVAAAAPTPAGWFRSTRDSFWDVLRGAGRESQSFDGSGWVFNALEMYLDSRHGFLFDRFGDTASSAQISKARRSSWLVLPATSAAEWLAALDGVEAEAGDVTAFIVGEHGPDGAAEGALAVRAALATLKTWLAAVTRGHVGLMSIG